MTDISKTGRPDVFPASVQHVDGMPGFLAAYLDELEARVAALDRRSSAVPLMTAADAARYARVNVETILRGGPGRRAPGGRLCRPLPPDLPRCPQSLARYQITLSAAGCSAAP